MKTKNSFIDWFIFCLFIIITAWFVLSNLTGCAKASHVNKNSELIEENSKAIAKHHPNEETLKTLKEAHEQALKDAAIVNKEAVAKAFKAGAASVGSMYGVPPVVTDTVLTGILGLFGLNKLNARRKKKKKKGAGPNDSTTT